VRVNPEIEAKTHAKIATGKAENEFDIPFSRAPCMAREVNSSVGLDRLPPGCRSSRTISQCRGFDWWVPSFCPMAPI
jgi:hypothetical protein